MRARAAILEAPRTPLVFEELDVGEPRAHEVLVRYGASGVCHSDLHVVDGEWTTPRPLVLGHEGAGTVEAVGAGVEHVGVGDRVVLSWHYPCGRCRQCSRGWQWICTESRSDDCVLDDGTLRFTRDGGAEAYQYLSLGTFAERAVVPASAAVRLPDGVPWDVASLIGCGVSTGVGAVLNTARVEAGAAVCIVGCGGVGLSVVMGAVLAGADPIIAVDLSDARLSQARELGATHTVRADQNVRRAVVGIVPGGVDWSFEAIGLRETVELMPRLKTPVGTCLMVGMTPEDVAVSLNGMLFPATGQRLLGSSYGSTVPAIDFPRFASLYLEGRLPVDRLITHQIELEEVNEAFDAMRRRERARSVIVYER